LSCFRLIFGDNTSARSFFEVWIIFLRQTYDHLNIVYLFHFRQALQLYKIDAGTVILEIIDTIMFSQLVFMSFSNSYCHIDLLSFRGDHLSPTVDGRSFDVVPNWENRWTWVMWKWHSSQSASITWSIEICFGYHTESHHSTL
jgi:hypothetical protein